MNNLPTTISILRDYQNKVVGLFSSPLKSWFIHLRWGDTKMSSIGPQSDRTPPIPYATLESLWR